MVKGGEVSELENNCPGSSLACGRLLGLQQICQEVKRKEVGEWYS